MQVFKDRARKCHLLMKNKSYSNGAKQTLTGFFKLNKNFNPIINLSLFTKIIDWICFLFLMKPLLK